MLFFRNIFFPSFFLSCYFFLKDHDALLRQVHEESQAGIRDLLDRRASAISCVTTFENQLTSRLAEIGRIQAQGAALQDARAAAEKKIAELTAELANERTASKTALKREEEADEELTEALRVISDKEREIAALSTQLAEREEDLEMQKNLNRGLEDDKEDMSKELKELRAGSGAALAAAKTEIESARAAIKLEVDAAKAAAKLELDAVKAAAAVAASSSAAQIERLKMELSGMQEDFDAANAVAEVCIEISLFLI
jgi:chromosome segregation ATPase